MAHEIFERMATFEKDPAWHWVGEVHQDAISAQESADRVGLDKVRITLEPTVTWVSGGLMLPTGGQEILRHPLGGADPTDPKSYARFGSVGQGYRLISHRDACRIWDEHVARPVDAMGVLYDGAAMFLCSKLGTSSILGDEVQHYGTLVNWCKKGHANQVFNSDVRTVCANTVALGWSRAFDKLSITHDERVVARTIAWLAEAFKSVEANLGDIRDAYTLMAMASITTPQAVEAVGQMFAEPPMPRKNVPPSVYAERLEDWEKDRKLVHEVQTEVMTLWEGRATGWESRAMKGTVFGLVQSAIEYNQYGGQRIRKKDRGASLLVGDYARRNDKVWQVGMDLAVAHAN
jgi:hypothetical protein